MPTIQDLPRIYSTYINSDYCPSLSTVVKTVAAVAGAIFSWRYAPRLTAIFCVAVAALYYGVRSLQEPSSPIRQAPDIQEKEETEDPLPATIPPADGKNQIVPTQHGPELQSNEAPDRLSPIVPVEEPLPPAEAPITSLADVNAWIESVRKSPELKRNIVPVLQYLKKTKPQGIEILAWQPCIPGTEKYNREGSPLMSYLQDEMFKLMPLFVEQFQGQGMHTEPSDEQRALILQMEKASTELTVKLVPELAFMVTIFSLGAVLERHPSLIQDFIPNFKKRKDPALRTDLQDVEFRKFIVEVIWLSRHIQGREHIFSLIKPDGFNTIIHPLDMNTWGPGLYVYFVACKQWYAVTKDQKHITCIERLQAEVQQQTASFNPFQDMLRGQFIQFMDGEIEQFFARLDPLKHRIKTLALSLAEKLKASSPRDVIEPIFMDTLIAMHQWKPPEMNVLEWDPPVMGSKRFMDALKAKTPINAANAESLLSLSDNSINLICGPLDALFTKEAIIAGNIFSLSSLIGDQPILSQMLVATIKAKMSNLAKLLPGDTFLNEDFRLFLFELLFLSGEKKGIECAIAYHPKLEKFAHPLKECADITPLNVFVCVLWSKSTADPKYKELLESYKIKVEESLEELQQNMKTAIREKNETVIENFLSGILLKMAAKQIIADGLGKSS